MLFNVEGGPAGRAKGYPDGVDGAVASFSLMAFSSADPNPETPYISR